jgi:hypothetical protein
LYASAQQTGGAASAGRPVQNGRAIGDKLDTWSAGPPVAGEDPVMSDEQRPGGSDRGVPGPQDDWRQARTGRFDAVPGGGVPGGGGRPDGVDATAPLDRAWPAADDTRAMPATPDDPRPAGADGPPAADDTRAMPGVPAGTPPAGGDQTRAMPAAGADQTRAMPPVAGEPAWSGRAQVQPPRPAAGAGATTWETAEPMPEGRRWWLPVLLGVVALLLLGGVAFGTWYVTRSGEGVPPTASSAPPSPAASPSPPSPSPSPTSASPSPSAAASGVAVPRIAGRPVGDALNELDRVGLGYRVTYRETAERADGTVIETDPAARSTVAPGTEVQVVVARRPASPSPAVTASSTADRTPPAR